LDILLGPEKEEGCLNNNEELDQYLTEKVMKHDTNPLSWWRDNESRVPQLAQVGTKSLHNIPAISTPSERIFLQLVSQ